MTASKHETRLFAGIKLIDTPLVRKSLEFARAHHDSMSFNHIYRSWIFGAIFASKIPGFTNVDLEIHAVSAILHDLAWDHTSIFATKDKRFEVDSANAARDFLVREAMDLDQRQLQIVWDSIALHTTPSIARYKEVEVVLCHMGITADFLGVKFPGGLLTREEYDAIIGELPLLDFKGQVKNLLCGLCKYKPETTYDNFVRDFGERFVDGYSVESKLPIDMLMKPFE